MCNVCSHVDHIAYLSKSALRLRNDRSAATGSLVSGVDSFFSFVSQPVSENPNATENMQRHLNTLSKCAKTLVAYPLVRIFCYCNKIHLTIFVIYKLAVQPKNYYQS